MNPVVKAQLNEFSGQNPGSGMSENELFEVYSTYAVTNGLLNENLDPFKIHLKGDEFGIDGAGILVEGELCHDSDAVAGALDGAKRSDVEFVFIQSKTSEKFDYGEVSKFLNAVYGFFTGKMGGESPQLDDLIGAKDKVYEAALRKNPSVRCFFVSTGKDGDYHDTLRGDIENRLFELNLFSDIQIELVGAGKLQECYRTATNAITAEFEFPKSITMPTHDSVDQAYIGYVEAKELLRLVVSGESEDSGRINRSVFFDNVRDFNSNSPINKSIVEGIEGGDNSSFVFKNNGVTVVAKGINRTGDMFRLEDYQIVNGCQTSNIIFECRDSIDGIYVPIRVIGAQDSDFISSIIVGTNKQNEVKEDQFWALKPFLKDLEEYFKNQDQDKVILLERREFQYREEPVERTRVMKPRDLMKAVAGMFLYRPHRAARDYRGIRKEFEEEVFQESHQVRPYHCAALASYRFDFLLRNNRIDRNWGVYKYYWMSALGGEFAEGKNIFSLKKGKQDKVCDDIVSVLMDEAKLIKNVNKVAGLLNKMVSEKPLKNREQLRDALRSEAFAKQFAREVAREKGLRAR